MHGKPPGSLSGGKNRRRGKFLRKQIKRGAPDRPAAPNTHLAFSKYAKDNGFRNMQFFIDDGVSGAAFERESFKAMLVEIENGKADTVMVKDMSRFGGDYLKVGVYTEGLFIAMNNGINRAIQPDSDFTPLLKIMKIFF